MLISAAYDLAIILGALAYTLSRYLDQGQGFGLPPDPLLMRVTARLAGACVLVLIPFGFWKLQWHVPIMVYVYVIFSSAPFARRLLGSAKAPGIVIGMSLISILLTVLLVSGVF
jgi:hypothetical protein